MLSLHCKTDKGKYQSGQMGQTVNLLAYAFGGSNPSLPTPEAVQLLQGKLNRFLYVQKYLI